MQKQICSYQAAPEGGIDLFINDQRDRMQRPETILFMSKCFVLFACKYARFLNTSKVFKLKWKFSQLKQLSFLKQTLFTREQISSSRFVLLNFQYAFDTLESFNM